LGVILCVRCGSDNDGGSRFCGVCGVRLGTVPPTEAAARVIAPPSGDGGPGITRRVPLARPATPPPVDAPPRVTAPTREIAAPAASPAAAPARAPATTSLLDSSLPGPVVPRRWAGGVLALLLLDAGLVVAGALLLRAGLAARAPGGGTAAAATADDRDAPADAARSGSGVATLAPPPADPPRPPPRKAADRRRDPPGPDRPASTAPAPRPPDAALPRPHRPPDAAPPTAPPADAAPAAHPDAGILDPYAQPPPDAAGAPPLDAPVDAPTTEDDLRTAAVADEVIRDSVRSKARFDHCYADAARAYTPEQPLAGEVDIAFRVMPTGDVENAAAVRNTTGSDKLAACLVSVLSAWTFPDNGLTEPASFVRPFRFDAENQP
jgi:hypothetical protein